jgi:hypothetical protein
VPDGGWEQSYGWVILKVGVSLRHRLCAGYLVFCSPSRGVCMLVGNVGSYFLFERSLQSRSQKVSEAEIERSGIRATPLSIYRPDDEALDIQPIVSLYVNSRGLGIHGALVRRPEDGRDWTRPVMTSHNQRHVLIQAETIKVRTGPHLWILPTLSTFHMIPFTSTS